MNITHLSITDLKASYDFALLYLKEIQEEAIKVDTKVEQLPLFKETNELKEKLYTQLLNRVRDLK